MSYQKPETNSPFPFYWDNISCNSFGLGNELGVERTSFFLILYIPQWEDLKERFDKPNGSRMYA